MLRALVLIHERLMKPPLMQALSLSTMSGYLLPWTWLMGGGEIGNPLMKFRISTPDYLILANYALPHPSEMVAKGGGIMKVRGRPPLPSLNLWLPPFPLQAPVLGNSSATWRNEAWSQALSPTVRAREAFVNRGWSFSKQPLGSGYSHTFLVYCMSPEEGIHVLLIPVTEGRDRETSKRVWCCSARHAQSWLIECLTWFLNQSWEPNWKVKRCRWSWSRIETLFSRVQAPGYRACVHCL